MPSQVMPSQDIMGNTNFNCRGCYGAQLHKILRCDKKFLRHNLGDPFGSKVVPFEDIVGNAKMGGGRIISDKKEDNMLCDGENA